MRLARLAPLFPKRLFLAACAVMLPLTLSPWPDLTVSGWFYRPGAGFYLRDLPLFRFILRDMPPLMADISNRLTAGDNRSSIQMNTRSTATL